MTQIPAPAMLQAIVLNLPKGPLRLAKQWPDRIPAVVAAARAVAAEIAAAKYHRTTFPQYKIKRHRPQGLLVHGACGRNQANASITWPRTPRSTIIALDSRPGGCIDPLVSASAPPSHFDCCDPMAARTRFTSDCAIAAVFANLPDKPDSCARRLRIRDRSNHCCPTWSKNSTLNGLEIYDRKQQMQAITWHRASSTRQQRTGHRGPFLF